jgi:hypothetical protein
MPYGTDVGHLTPSIGIMGKTIAPASDVENDFTGHAHYTVTGVDSTTRVYTVTIYVQTLSDLKIIAYDELGIDYANHWYSYNYLGDYTLTNWTTLDGYYDSGILAISTAGNPTDITTAKNG